MSNEKKVEFTIRLSQDEAENLLCWAAYHGKGKGAYASQIVGARIEANLDLIDGLVQRAASSRGITPEEMRNIWLGKEGQDEGEDS